MTLDVEDVIICSMNCMWRSCSRYNEIVVHSLMDFFTTFYVLYVLLALFNYLKITGNMKLLVSSKLGIGNVFNKSMLLKVL